MERLKLRQVSVWRAGHRLFTKVSLALRDGERLGIVGHSGAGKSSLLEAIAGDLAYEGQILRAPGSRLVYLPQRLASVAGTVWEVACTALQPVSELEKAMRAEEQRMAEGSNNTEAYAALVLAFEALGGYQAEAQLKAQLLAFGFAEVRFDQPVSSLSGGELQRLMLVKALAEQPDILLLDEPSNHLDLPTRQRLIQALSHFPGVLLMVSHDRALMDAVCSHIAQLKEGEVRLSKGNYRSFEQQSQQWRTSLSKSLREQQKTERQVQGTLEQLRSWGTVAAARQRKRLERRLSPSLPAATGKTRQLQFAASRLRGMLYRAKHLSKTLFDNFLLDDVALQIEAGDKIGLIGANGSGKSTLLRLIAGELESDHPEVEMRWHEDVRLAYSDQQWRGLLPDRPAIEQLAEYVTTTRARMLLALVGLGPERWQHPPAQFSAGERARLSLAVLMAAEKTLLLLDEPTNDLDLQMIELLEDALVTTEASVLLVSHDERLLEAVCTRLWSIEQGKIVEYRGGLKGYTKGRRRREDSLVTELPEMEAEVIPRLQSVEELEHERHELEETLLDPLRLTEREQQRLHERHHEVMDALSERYGQALPAAAPRYSYALAGVQVSSDGLCEGVALLTIADVVHLKLLKPPEASVAHLSFVEMDDRCLLDWIKPLVLRLAARIAFEHLNCSALQIQQNTDLSSAGFQAAADGWWLFSRSRYEEQEGFRQRKHQRKRRRKLRAGS